jgi:hypothetical protein
MGKYEPLGQYLRKQKAMLVPMTFEEIERVIGAKLPNSRRYPAWWSNNPFNNVMTQVWLDAGFETEQVDVEDHRVVFRRVREVAPNSVDPAMQNTGKHHPAYGCLAGTVQVAPGVDLTEPADPEWGDHAWGDKPWSDDK